MQASCLGLADVLPGRSWAELRPHFERLFTALLRVLDDVKESVRKAALAGWRAVCNAASRLSDPASGSVSAEQALSMLGLVLPLLLESHTHNSAEVRSLAAKQMLKLCESGGKHLSPHAVRLVPALLENLSVLEDQALNYLQQHAEAAGVSEQAMESARIAATRGSDSSGALEQLLKVMGQEQVAAVAPQLAHLLSHGVGLPTRVGTARFVLQLAQSHGAQFKGVAPRMLTTLRAAILTERSATARRAYASAAAIVSRLCSAEQLAELVRGLASRYAGEGSPHATDEDARMTVALFVRELLRGAPDAMAAVRVEWLPLAYLGRHEPRWQSEPPTKRGDHAEPGKLAAVWREAYDEAGISSGIALLHVPELLALLAGAVNGLSWALRRAAALSIVELVAVPQLQAAPRARLLELAALLADKQKKWYDKEAELPKLQKLLDAAAPPAAAAAPPAASEPASGDE